MPLKSIRPKYWVYPYGPSNSANGLIALLKGRLIRREGSRYAYKSGDVCINWGTATRPAVLNRAPVLNSFEAVRTATSKLATFSKLAEHNVRIPPVSRLKGLAAEWGTRVLGRDLDHGSQGNGITVYERGSALGDHQFYVGYWRKHREFRVHVFMGQVIFVQEKLKKNGARDDPTFSPYIRSHDRGWCFAFNHFNTNPVPNGVREVAIAAVCALGLTFGAADIGWNERDGACCFEVNTAPGIEESSLQAYANAFGAL
jgi:hypothetical protein